MNQCQAILDFYEEPGWVLLKKIRMIALPLPQKYAILFPVLEKNSDCDSDSETDPVQSWVTQSGTNRELLINLQLTPGSKLFSQN